MFKVEEIRIFVIGLENAKFSCTSLFIISKLASRSVETTPLSIAKLFLIKELFITSLAFEKDILAIPPKGLAFSVKVEFKIVNFDP